MWRRYEPRTLNPCLRRRPRRVRYPTLHPACRGLAPSSWVPRRVEESPENLGEIAVQGEIDGIEPETARSGSASMNGHSRSASRAPVLSSLLAADRDSVTRGERGVRRGAPLIGRSSGAARAARRARARRLRAAVSRMVAGPQLRGAHGAEPAVLSRGVRGVVFGARPRDSERNNKTDPGAISAKSVHPPQGEWRALDVPCPARAADPGARVLQVVRASRITCSTTRRARSNCRGWSIGCRSTCSRNPKSSRCWRSRTRANRWACVIGRSWRSFTRPACAARS